MNEPQQKDILDRPVEQQAVLTDPEVQTLYHNGHIGRPLAEVFNIIADFNDNRDQGGAICSKS